MTMGMRTITAGTPVKRTARPEDRFWSRVESNDADSCWLWTGSVRGNNKYGVFEIAGKPIQAHRFSWELHHGLIPVGQCVLHRCDTPRCVNPSHLFLGTHQQNMADMAAKGRAPKNCGEKCGTSKLTDAQVLDIRTRRAAGEKQSSIAESYGLTQQAISYVCLRGWRHVGGVA